MQQSLRTALSLLVVLSVILGVVYPCAVTFIAQITLPHQANGSLVAVGDRVVGSELIGQTFSGPAYFWGRPSATAPDHHNAAASGGSNLGMLNPQLLEDVHSRVDQLRTSGVTAELIPVDLVTSSASGLDPHISPQAAEVQVVRVAKARGLSEDLVRSVVARHTSPRQFGALGESTVNVLLLNLALDQLTDLQK